MCQLLCPHQNTFLSKYQYNLTFVLLYYPICGSVDIKFCCSIAITFMGKLLPSLYWFVPIEIPFSKYLSPSCEHNESQSSLISYCMYLDRDWIFVVNCLLHMMTCACGDILCDILASEISCGCGSVDILQWSLPAALSPLWGSHYQVCTNLYLSESLSPNNNHLAGSVLNNRAGWCHVACVPSWLIVCSTWWPVFVVVYFASLKLAHYKLVYQRFEVLKFIELALTCDFPSWPHPLACDSTRHCTWGTYHNSIRTCGTLHLLQ